jgi:hypothetical protein
MENHIKKWLSQFKSEPKENTENVYIPIVKTVYPDERLSYNEQAKHIYQSLKQMKYEKP